MRSQQQKQQHNDSGLFSSLKSMANDLIGNSPSHHQQHQQHQQHSSQQSVKRSTNVSSTPTTSTPQINTNTNSTTSKTQTLFPSYQTLQTALPQEIERVRSVLQNPNATLSQLEQGDRALDDLVVLLASKLVQLTELKRENSQKLIHKLKQQTGNNNSNVSINSPMSAKSPVSSTSTTNTPQVVKTNSSTPTTETSAANKGFGALANRSTSAKPSTPSSNAPVKTTNVPPKATNPLESMLDWQENEVVVEPPKPQVKEQELFSMDSFDDSFTHSANNTNTVPPPATTTVTMDDDILGFDNGATTTAPAVNSTQSADDILGFETSDKPKEGAFLDELLGTEKNGNQGVMIDFSDEGQKIYQSNQILSMFDKPAESTTASILDADDIPVATTTTVNSVDEFDF